MSLRDRLRLVFRSADDDPAVGGAGAPAIARPATELEVVAYAEDCRLFGHLALSASRLTDMLNDADEIELVDVAVEALTDGRIVEMRSMVVRRDELLVVQATGPRGDRARRQRTRPHPVAVKTGPYLVRGHLHAMPTTDPFVAFRRRPPMVPLTDGSISYTVGDSTVVRSADTIIVNRMVIDWVAPSAEADAGSPELPPLPTAKGILLKDFTGEIHPVPHDDDVETPPVIVIAGHLDARTIADEPPATAPADASPAAPVAPAETDPPTTTLPVKRSRKALRRAG